MKWRRRAILIAISLALSLLAGEIGLRLHPRLQAPSTPVRRSPDFRAYDDYGYGLWPSRSTTITYPTKHSKPVKVVSNRHGFRSGREFDEMDSRTRIVVAGDSFAFGLGVEEDERFTNQLEAMEPSWRVDSLGMSGFGPDLMVRALEALAPAARPDVVVLTMHTDDFRRVRPHYAGMGFPILRYELRGQRLVSVPYPKIHFWDRLGTVVLLRHLYWTFSGAEYRLNEAILERFHSLAVERRFRPAIVFLPGEDDMPFDRSRRQWLEKQAHRHSTPYLDLSAAFHGRPAKELLIPKDMHWTPEGHRLVAAELRQFLRQRMLLAGEAP